MADKETRYDVKVRAMAQWIARQRQGKLLIRAAEREWEDTRQGPVRTYLDPYVYDDSALDHWRVFMEEIVGHSGRHRHQGGLVIYVVEGEGSTEVDGRILAWKAGDLLLLPLKPGGVAHQHFNRVQGQGCRWIAFVYRPLQEYVAHHLTQLNPDDHGPIKQEWGSDWRAVAPEEEPLPLIREPQALGRQNLFDWLLALRDQQRRRQLHTTWLIAGDELPWEINRHGKMQWYLHPAIAYSTIHTLTFYRQEIPVGSRSGLQRHAGDVVFFVIQGQGYTEVDGVRYHWSPEDLMTLPIRPEGVVYRHVNTGATPVHLVACEPNLVFTVDVDRGVGFEELEVAPEWGGSSQAP